MANKTESEVALQLKDYVTLWKIVNDFLEGPMENQLELIEDEINTGDSNSITNLQTAALSAFRNQLNNFFLSSQGFVASVAPTLSELAGHPSPGQSASADIAWFHDYMTDNSKAVKSRGFTKAVWTADGSNTGDGRIVQHTADLATLDIDVAHPDPSLRLRCMQPAGQGVTAGQEPFELIGSKVDRIWEDNGIGQGVYSPALGKGFNDLNGKQRRVDATGLDARAMRSMSGGSSLNMASSNGSFEASVSGTANDRFSGMTIISGGTNLSIESTSPIVGSQSLKIDGDFVAYIPLNQNGLSPKTAVAFGAIVNKVIASSTLTGTLTLALRSGGTKASAASGTAHKTISVTVGSLTDNTNTDQDDTLIIPAALGVDPRIEITMASYSDGSGTGNSLLLDEVYAGHMYQFDMGQFILPVRGPATWELDDFFTSAVTEETDEGTRGATQEFFNRVFGRYVKHAASATTFTDPSLLPEIQAYNSAAAAVADGGTITLGATSTSEQLVTIAFENTGVFPLAVVAPTDDNSTNASITTTPSLIVVQPNRRTEVVVGVTPGGAGAFSIDVHFVNNDSGESPYDITISGTAS